ncbi:MAG: septum formation initiator family protein [Lachnospiraceae bacterium]|nr:septum formation initiator family protein [Lachnospiraceae bacterium]
MLPRGRRKRHNRTAKLLIGFVVVLVLVVTGIQCNELRQRRDYYAEKEMQLSAEIEAEEERAEEISEYETYTHTKAYIEEIARNKLGLVYEGEILFKDEN